MSDFMTTLMLSHLRPYMVEKVMAGWERPGPIIMSGFIVKLVDGRFAYIWSHRDPQRDSIMSSTQYFEGEPRYLYERATDWNRDEKVLNADLPFAKQNAKYPKEEEPTDRGREGASCSRPGVRFSTA